MIIYKAKNSINGKVYIGQTVTSLEERWKNHQSKSSGCRALSSAIHKYGPEAFVVEQIDTAQSLSELNKKEEFYIKKFNSLAPHGYNLKIGGDQPRLCEESLKRASESKKGMKAWNEGLTKDDPRVAKYVKSGEDNYWYGKVGHRKGKKHTQEAKRKISEAHRGKKTPLETRRKMSEARKNSPHLKKVQKKVQCVETGVVYESISEASRQLDLQISGISNVLSGKLKTTGGYKFVFYKD